MTKNVLLIAALLAAGVFAYLWYTEKQKSQTDFSVDKILSGLDSSQETKLYDAVLKKVLSRWKKDYHPLTDPLDPAVATDWVNYYKASSFFTSLNKKEGTYHDLEKLIKYLSVWKTKGATRVDFRYAKYPANFPYVTSRNQFAIILYPQVNNVDMAPAQTTDPEWQFTIPLNLGDLHP